MSQENVEVVRRAYEAFARHDLDAILEMADPEIEAHDPPEVPDATVYYGRAAVRRDWEQTIDLFEDFKIDVEKLFDAGNDVVLFVRYSGRGKESGAAVEALMAHVITLREGKAIRLRQFLDRAAALKAVGLSEQDAHTDS